MIKTKQLSIALASLLTVLVVLGFATLLPGCANAKTYQVKDNARAITIIGGIDGNIIDLAETVHNLAEANSDPIYMLINSPGGAVLPGMIFIDAMKAAQSQGVKFVCTSTVMSASMAFIIYAQCDERYALENTRLLFHPMSTSAKGARVRDLHIDLGHTVKEELRIMKTLADTMDMDYELFIDNYYAETFWQAKLLEESTSGFLTTVTSVRGFGKYTYKYKSTGLFNISGKALDVLRRFEEEGPISK